MSIGKRVAEAFEEYHAGDPEGALMQVCAAIEATATAEYGKEGRRSYKEFLHDNLGLITKVAFGASVLNINLGYTHPRIESGTPGMCSFQDIVYHAVRCSLYHTASVSSDLRFHDSQSFRVENNQLLLPASLVLGFIVAVVVSPVNKSEATLRERCELNISGYQVPLKRLWGKRQELLELYRAMDAIQRDGP